VCRPIPLYKETLEEHVPKNATFILEIGTGGQISTKIFHDIAFKNKGMIWTIDKAEANNKLEGVFYITSDSLKVRWRNELDLLFIDGFHTKLYVSRELRKFGSWVRFGGQIILDDVEGRVKEALEEFCEEHSLMWNFLSQPPSTLAVVHVSKDLSMLRNGDYDVTRLDRIKDFANRMLCRLGA